MWILLAFGSALFAGLTAILAKCGTERQRFFYESRSSNGVDSEQLRVPILSRVGHLPEVCKRTSFIAAGTRLEPAWSWTETGGTGKLDHFLCPELFPANV